MPPKMPSRELILAFLHIDQEARHSRPQDIFTWKKRPRKYFKTDRDWKIWNTRFAGKPAGSLTDGYIQICLDKISYPGHRILYYLDTGKDPGEKKIDHRNGISSCNSPWNLREATTSQNGMNRKTQKNFSGVKGVYWNWSIGKWIVHIHINCKETHLGCFTELKKAIEVRQKAEKFYYGKFRKGPTLAELLVSHPGWI